MTIVATPLSWIICVIIVGGIGTTWTVSLFDMNPFGDGLKCERIVVSVVSGNSNFETVRFFWTWHKTKVA